VHLDCIARLHSPLAQSSSPASCASYSSVRYHSLAQYLLPWYPPLSLPAVQLSPSPRVCHAVCTAWSLAPPFRVAVPHAHDIIRTPPSYTDGYLVYTGLFSPDIVSELQQSHEWTIPADGRSFAALKNCTVDDTAGTGQRYKDGWGRW
jgi:hypothetical protein